MTTDKCVYGKITKTNLVQRNSEDLGKREKKKKLNGKKKKGILESRQEF